MILATLQQEEDTSSRAVPEFAFLTEPRQDAACWSRTIPRIRMRDIADMLGITERATQRIVADLAKAGYIERERDGRRNLYGVRGHLPLGLPMQRDIDIGALLAILPTASGSS